MPAPRPAALLLLLAALALAIGCAVDRQGRREVRSVRLEGTRQLDDDDVLEGLATQPTPWWPPWGDPSWFDASALDVDARRVEAYYAAHGLFRARVVGKQIHDRDGGEAVDVVLTVEEDGATRVSEVRVDGLDVLSPAERAGVQGGVSVLVGERFDHGLYTASRDAVAAQLKTLGFPWATARGEVSVDRDAQTAVVRITASPGPRARFGEARLTGEGDLPGDLLLHRVAWSPGDPFDPADVERTRVRLFDTRVLSSVRLSLPDEPTETPDIRIRVKPGLLREVRVGTGLGIERDRQEALVHGRWTLRNFLGGLRTLEVRVKPAFVALPAVWERKRVGIAAESEVRLTQPDLLGTDVDAAGSFGFDLDIDEAYRSYGPHSRMALDRTLFDDLVRVTLSWNGEWLFFFDVVEEAFDPSKTPLGLGFVNPYRLIWLEEAVQLDLRDDALDPREGLLFQVALEEGHPVLLGDFTYFKFQPELRVYLPLGTPRFVLAGRASIGRIVVPEGDASPITRRVALGGPNSHRGFTSGRLSYQQLDESTGRLVPVGANASFLISGDLRLRVVRLANNWLSFVPFFDAGEAVLDFHDIDVGKLHLAVGAGLHYMTPIGSVRLSLAARLNRLSATEPDGRQNPDPGDRLAFHLTIGEAF